MTTHATGRVYLRAVRKHEDAVPSDAYPWSIPCFRDFDTLSLAAPVVFFIGENGSGKSTLLEAIAIAAGMNAEGGSRNFAVETRASHSDLHASIRLVRNPGRPTTDFFLRSESLFTVATWLEGLGGAALAGFGGRSLHEMSHGEAFLAIAMHRFGPNGLYIMDEPEAALSPHRQLSLLARMHQLVEDDSQFIIATHSPILLAYPGAMIYQFSERGIVRQEYEETEQFELTRDFLNHRERYLQHLFIDED